MGKKISKEKAEPDVAKYFFAVGRRKTAIAKVKLCMGGEGEAMVNNRKVLDYFPILRLQKIVTAPLSTTGLLKKVNLMITVRGGGVSAQAQAASLGISRALVKADPALRLALKKGGFLTRDARKRERKKPGLKRARRAPQWQKR